MHDHLIRALSRDGRLRAVAAQTTTLVETLRQRQGTDPTASVALGRLATGAALLGALLKGEQRLALRIEGNGPLGRLHAESDAAGRVRATLTQPRSGIAPGVQGFDVPAAIGRVGFLTVTKDLGLGQPYRGTVQLYNSEVAADLAWYLTTSEQVPSSMALGVYVEADGQISAAGGYLFQVMPPRDDTLLADLEQHLQTVPPPTTLLRSGRGPRALLATVFAQHAFDVLQETPVRFRCTCSRRQVARVLAALPAAEKELLRAEGGTSVTCEFCKEVYRFTSAELT